MTQIPKSLQELLNNMSEFKTAAWFNEGMNQIQFQTEDVQCCSENDPNSLIQSIRAVDNDRIIGFKIENPQVWMKHCKETEED